MGRNVLMSDGTQMWVPDPDPGYTRGDVGHFQLQLRRKSAKPEPKHRPPYLSVALRMEPGLIDDILELLQRYWDAREEWREVDMRLALEFPEKPEMGTPEHRAWAGLRRSRAYRENTAGLAKDDLVLFLEYAERYFAVLRERRTK